MTEYHEMVKEAADARIGADRMAMGLSCIPDPLRGDMAEIERLTAALNLEQRRLRVSEEALRRALENKP